MLWLIGTLVEGTDIEGHSLRKQSRRKSIVQPFMIFYSLAHPRGPRPNRRAGLPPFAHDGTERRIVRPQDATEQTACYSGKKKDHTVKNVLLVNALLTILFLSDTYGGRSHDKRIAEA